MIAETVDFAALGAAVELNLLRAIVFGGRRSVDMSLLLDSQKGGKADYQALALAIADLSLSEDEARRTFEALSAHQERLARTLGRQVGLKTAALDLLENVERALKLDQEAPGPSYYQLEQMAFRDHLTGLHNFRYFNLRLTEEFKRAKRYRHPLSLVMLDIDHFKRFNDTHGHPAGNEALRQLASQLASVSRETDNAARYGGEEFAFILPETSQRLALEMAERLRANVEAKPVVLEDGSHHRLTVSLGVATYPRDAWTPESLVEAADQALYQSKQAGRNRVRAFEPREGAHFCYRPAPGEVISKAAVVGNFNGWDPLADPMHPQGDGSFACRVALVPGSYEYKFVLNGERWIPDPQAAEHVSDGYRGQNSILHVKREA